MAQGFLGVSASVAMPSILSLISRRAYGAEDEHHRGDPQLLPVGLQLSRPPLERGLGGAAGRLHGQITNQHQVAVHFSCYLRLLFRRPLRTLAHRVR